MRRAAVAAVPLFIGDRHQHISAAYWFPVAKRAAVVEKFPNLVLQLSLYYRMYALWMHYKALRRKRDLLAHTLKVETGGGGGKETEMRRAHGHRTSTFIICYGTTLNCLADSHRFKMRIYSLVYQTLTLAFMVTGFQTVKPYPLINQMLQPTTLLTKTTFIFTTVSSWDIGQSECC